MSDAQKTVLVVLDGWGHSEEREHNAIARADTPHWDALWKDCPRSLLQASGADVGLPDGQMGNSEVGHSTMGAGRVLWQSLARIDSAVAQDGFATNEQIVALLQGVKQRSGALHLMGLVSDGGVHSHVNHLLTLIQLARQTGVGELVVHAILDGRDVPPRSAEASLQRVEQMLEQCDYRPIADLVGRYWAMDRDRRWDRTERGWKLYTAAEGIAAGSAVEALRRAYDEGQSDEFVEPMVCGAPAPVRDGDALLLFNFRTDRMRQLASAFCAKDFEGFARLGRPELADTLTLTEYQPGLPVRVAFAPEAVTAGLGEVLAEQGLGQLRIAETEKFAHVTYFFSCGREEPFAGEIREMIPSPQVATYDLAPEMSALQITQQLEQQMRGGDWRFAVCNFANGDMVGHTGKLDAAVRAVGCIDDCLGKLRQVAAEVGANLCITADHGNCEAMRDHGNAQAHTAHTLNPVPFVYSGPTPLRLRPEGGLADVAPTLLRLMGLEQPAEMTGRPLVED